MFCRISANRTQGGEMRYCPFRLTPYQLTIKDSDAAEPQPCCLLIAERVHSGYEGSPPLMPLKSDVSQQTPPDNSLSACPPLIFRLCPLSPSDPS